MPCYSAIFQGFIKTNTIMSLRPPTTATPLHFHFHFHLNPNKTLKPSLFSVASFVTLRCHQIKTVRYAPSHLKHHGVVRCFGVADRVAVGFWDWRTFALPYLCMQSLNYGRYAYQDESSDDSDLEVGSPQQALVGFYAYPFC